ncbi:MAG TPA: tetratricopeptide repeat protein [Gemmatimonadales bacterium]|nr:tetratricopeptide repeat protein [Gemmatimonadales bacterium]
MIRSLRLALIRFALARATASLKRSPKLAAFWLRMACGLSTSFGEPFVALVHLLRTQGDRWGAVAAAQQASERFKGNPDAWMLLGEAYQMVFRQKEALEAYEEVLVLEERSDAALAAGELYLRMSRPAEAAARFARAYAAGGGAVALWSNARALFQAGDTDAAEQALALWAAEVPNGLERLPAARAELASK